MTPALRRLPFYPCVAVATGVVKTVERWKGVDCSSKRYTVDGCAALPERRPGIWLGARTVEPFEHVSELVWHVNRILQMLARPGRSMYIPRCVLAAGLLATVLCTVVAIRTTVPLGDHEVGTAASSGELGYIPSSL